jgi:hypothetical protein
LPNNWLLGQVASVAVGPDDHVWLLQRPRSLTDDEKGATLKPPRNKCCAPAPSVMEFDADGNFIQGWGFPQTTPWVANEHGIHVDKTGFVWIAGNNANDSAIFKYTKDGKPVLTIGKLGPDRRQQRHRPARATGRHPGRRRRARGLRRRRLRQPPRHRLRFGDRRLQAALGRLWQQAQRRQAAGL